MSRRVICQVCRKELTSDKAYKVTHKGRNLYYCSKEEYDNMISNKKLRDECEQMMVDIFGLPCCLPILSQEINKLKIYYDYPIIKKAIQNSLKNINWILQHKHFENEYGKIKYVFAVIENNILQASKEYKQEQEQLKQIFKNDNVDMSIFNETNDDTPKNNSKDVSDISAFLD